MDSFHNSTNISNILYGCNGEVGQMGSRAESLAMATVMFIVIALSLFGNGLVIVAIYNFQTLREATYALLCSLAISDLLSPLARLLPLAVSNVGDSWVFGCMWCTLSCAVGTCFSASSIFHLVFITIERFLSIRYPLKHNVWVTKRMLTAVITFIWLLSLAMAALPFIDNTIEYNFSRNILGCEIYLFRKPLLSLIKLGIYFGIPLFLMIFVYSQVFRVASLQANKILHNSVGDKKFKRKKIFQQHWKAAKIVFVIVGMFFILWSPYFITSSIKAYSYFLPYWLERGALICAYTNSCCNWIVYSVMNKNMRSSFLKLLRMENTVPLKVRYLQWRRRNVVDTVETSRQEAPPIALLPITAADHYQEGSN